MYKEQLDLLTALYDMRQKNSDLTIKVSHWLLYNMGDTEEPLAYLWVNDNYKIHKEDQE